MSLGNAGAEVHLFRLAAKDSADGSEEFHGSEAIDCAEATDASSLCCLLASPHPCSSPAFAAAKLPTSSSDWSASSFCEA